MGNQTWVVVSLPTPDKRDKSHTDTVSGIVSTTAECLQEAESVERTTLSSWEQRLWERRISSWLPFAYLSHDTASHAAWAGLGPPPGPAWLFCCLNSSVWLPQWSPELSEGPQRSSSSLRDPESWPPCSPHPPPSGPAKTQHHRLSGGDEGSVNAPR